MLIMLNGEKTTVAERCTVQGLIDHLGLSKVRVAVEVNREIVARGRWAEYSLKPDDQVEVVHFVGGGEGI
jgi:thiamine biosynthesis protein ThiS